MKKKLITLLCIFTMIILTVFTGCNNTNTDIPDVTDPTFSSQELTDFYEDGKLIQKELTNAISQVKAKTGKAYILTLDDGSIQTFYASANDIPVSAILETAKIDNLSLSVEVDSVMYAYVFKSNGFYTIEEGTEDELPDDALTAVSYVDKDGDLII